MQINIQKRHLFIILALVVFLAGVILVFAANPTTKPNPGHYSQEVMVNIRGTDKTLQEAIDLGQLGPICHWEKSWQNYLTGVNIGNSEIINEKKTCDLGQCQIKADITSCNPSLSSCFSTSAMVSCGVTSPEYDEWLYCC